MVGTILTSDRSFWSLCWRHALSCCVERLLLHGFPSCLLQRCHNTWFSPLAHQYILTLLFRIPPTPSHTNTHKTTTEDADAATPHPTPAFFNSFIYLCWVSIEVLTAFRVGINGVQSKSWQQEGEKLFPQRLEGVRLLVTHAFTSEIVTSFMQLNSVSALSSQVCVTS